LLLSTEFTTLLLASKIGAALLLTIRGVSSVVVLVSLLLLKVLFGLALGFLE
jgi:hypothetical protein